MFKIKLLILLLTSVFVIGCSVKQELIDNRKYSLDYIGGEYDGLLLKNTLVNNLKSFNLYDQYSKYQVKTNIQHDQNLFITNIDNTSDREKILSTLKVEVSDLVNQCKVFIDDSSISQFYIFASSDQFISNKVALKKIKKENTKILVKKLVQKLVEAELDCIE